MFLIKVRYQYSRQGTEGETMDYPGFIARVNILIVDFVALGVFFLFSDISSQK
jgi:hypothetical protein